MFEIITGLTNN